ncbi:hypothetical protein EMCG_04574 [[Emmonsia] crescens]|uniref:Uncharacterized protein n=1 Tax=[Emmonsia] crescens TaxID=73230 RepID=A0A0G2IYP4_9EURO|nr:hypothetical protein EMCG_04574 [Emmonsia crescens UAMH 3008]
MTSRAANQSLDSLKGWFFGSKQRIAKLLRGNGTPGERAGPTRAGNNDSKIGSRLDFNIDAENSTIRKAAQKNSHRKVSYANVEIKEIRTDDESEAAVNQLFTDLQDNAQD